jgi:RNA polymerase sigma-70 factor (ECF subfamily)
MCDPPWQLPVQRCRDDHRRCRPEAELDETIEATLVDPSDDPALALEKKSQGEMLRRALGELSSDHRAIIDLVYYHEKSIDEAAQIIGIPAATVKTRMFYARKKLAEIVAN